MRRLAPGLTGANNARAMSHDLKSSGASDLPLFRFGLRHLFAFVAALSALLAGMVIANGVTALVLLMAALVISAHVLSTALGSRLRAHADQQIIARHSQTRPQEPIPVMLPLRPLPFWHLHGRQTLGWMPILVLAGSLVAAAGGGAFLMLLIGDRASPAAVVVGVVSLAVLGGWFAFLASNFYTIFRRGLREASAHDQCDRIDQLDNQLIHESRSE
jgi:hypothetical protein